MKLIKTLLFIAAPFIMQAQTNVYTGNVQLGTQAAVDAFGSQYTKITGKLQVYGATVKNLGALSNIDTVLGKVEILTTDSLASLNGLNLEYIGNNLFLEGNKSLKDITALQNVTYVGKDLVILDCDSLKSLSGLDNIDSVKGSIYIGTQAWSTPVLNKSNDMLENLCALSNLITNNGLIGSYNVANNAFNPVVTDYAIGKCANPVFQGNIQLGSQDDINAFNTQYKVITGKLQVFGATSKDLGPLSGIDSVLGKLEILTTDSLEDLDGLNVTYVGSNVYLGSNKSLNNIQALQSLKYIGKDLVIMDCDMLMSLDGLENVDSVKGSVYIGTEAWKTPPVNKGNDTLTDFCAIKNLVVNGGISGTYNVDYNNYNPTKTDMVNGKCLKPVTSVNDVAKTGKWSVSTSPTDFLLSIPQGLNVTALMLVDLKGQLLYENKFQQTTDNIKLNHLVYPSAMYILCVQHAGGVERIRVVK